MSATLYLVDGTQREVTPANGKDFTLEEVYELIGCDMVEILPLGDPNMTFIGDENARNFEDAKVNIEATRIYRDSFGITNPKEQYAKQMEQMKQMYGDSLFIMSDPMETEPYSIVGNILYCPTVMFD